MDVRRTDYTSGKEVNFIYLSPEDFMPPIDKVTSVAVVPFMPNGDIVAVVLERGLDIPGGHVQIVDKSFEDTVIRESKEEANIEIGNLKYVSVISSDFYGMNPEDLTYMIIMTAVVAKLDAFSSNDESTSRILLSIKDFIKDYIAGDKRDMLSILVNAYKVNFNRDYIL